MTRHSSDDDSQLFSWEQNTSPAVQETSYRQHGLSVHLNPQRVGRDPRPSEFDYSHPRVDDFVNRFQTDLRNFYTGALERSGQYVPRMSSILEKEGLPQALAYLPLIESGFRPHAVSRAGAVGPWQLIPGTGRRYGLRIDRYVDERRDPVKSTHAAARYLKDLHAMFNDWHLSLAAYNTGEGNISRILERGRADDFWEMSDRGFLYEETENFVPEFLAALHIAEDPESYGFETPSGEPTHYDLVKVSRPLSLAMVARLSGVSTHTIEDLNPALHRGMIPPTGYSVRLPKGSKDSFQVALANLPRTVPGLRTHKRSRTTKHGAKLHKANGKQHGHRTAVVAAVGRARKTKTLAAATTKKSPSRATRRLHAGRTVRSHIALAARHKGHVRVVD